MFDVLCFMLFGHLVAFEMLWMGLVNCDFAVSIALVCLGGVAFGSWFGCCLLRGVAVLWCL